MSHSLVTVASVISPSTHREGNCAGGHRSLKVSPSLLAGGAQSTLTMVQLSSSLPHSLRGELYPECKSKFPKLMWPRRSLPSRNTQPVSIHQPLPLTHGLSEGLLPLPWSLCPTVTTMSMSMLSKALCFMPVCPNVTSMPQARCLLFFPTSQGHDSLSHIPVIPSSLSYDPGNSDKGKVLEMCGS